MLYKNGKMERLWALANMGEFMVREDSLSAIYAPCAAGKKPEICYRSPEISGFLMPPAFHSIRHNLTRRVGKSVGKK